MAGMAAQQAPGKRQAPSKASASKAEKKKSVRQRLNDMPQAAGIAALVLLCVLALPVGNLRALQNATPAAFLRQGDVKSIVEDRIAAAGNALTVASRGDVSDQLTADVQAAIEQLQKAKSAREISRADQKLTAAVSEMVAAASDSLDAENQRMLTRAADDFAEQGSFLRQEARAYNEQAEKAEKLYEKLPTKFLFAQPDSYEGV
ncbi:MAG: hypothetical protein Q4F18_12845 [Clostridia bacterium]|nr:hypothetical protein [Clostridia bacterium]